MIIFSSIVQNLDITGYSNKKPFLDNFKDSTIKAILKHKHQPSTATIRNQCKKEIEHLILNHDVNKISQSSDIPLKIVKDNIDIFSDFLCASFNSSINLRKFPKNPKLADITPLYKKGKKDIKVYYRPVSILPSLSKVVEKCDFTQM